MVIGGIVSIANDYGDGNAVQKMEKAERGVM
jgi:hypothetical protein